MSFAVNIEKETDVQLDTYERGVSIMQQMGFGQNWIDTLPESEIAHYADVTEFSNDERYYKVTETIQVPNTSEIQKKSSN